LTIRGSGFATGATARRTTGDECGGTWGRHDHLAPPRAQPIKSIVAQGRRVRQPANFGDYGETLTVTAVVEDAQTNPAALTYQWHACGGTFTGTGPQVEWKAPASGALPTTCTVEVIVSDGPRVVTGSVAVRLHNSATEVSALALEFLTEFADSNLPADERIVRNFSDTE
jgi:hypothetical protein